MARYFAEVKDDVVQRVIVCESKEWLEEKLGGEWVETFMDDKNKRYAGKGYTYHADKTNYAPPKPYPSWTQKEDLSWEAPKLMPEVDMLSGTRPIWNEDTQDWEMK